MRIGIDAHILSQEHHKHHPEIADYTRMLVRSLLEQDKDNSYVLFVDSRMPKSDLDEFTKPNVEFKHFPFSQYRAYLPFFYSHMLVSSILSAARLDVFHSPEGLIPYLYPGKVVATFHWVPTGNRDSNIFVNTWMFGARTGFAALCRKANYILLKNGKDRDILCGIHKYPEERAHVIMCEDCKTVDWEDHSKKLIGIYQSLKKEKPLKKEKLPGEKVTLTQRLAKLRASRKKITK